MNDQLSNGARNYAVETMAVNLDVTRPDSVDRMVKTIAGRFDAVYILVNNAGASFGVLNAVHTYEESA
jgi:NADP-dependent 3-hydroxy acid dehydrogenase YdfG